MKDSDHPTHRELMPDVNSALNNTALSPLGDPDPEPKFDPDDPGAAWLLGDDPEAEISRISDHRNAVKKQLKSEGAQFIYGFIILAVSLGSLALAATIQTTPLYITAGLLCPFGFWLFRSRWKRWLGSGPYCYRLLTSLGEDAEGLRAAHAEKQRKKHVNAIGALYKHS